MTGQKNKIQTAILGASGYTGAELLRLLACHPGYDIRALTAERHAGEAMDRVFPHLGGRELPTLVKIDDVNFDDIETVFCGLPHGTTQEIIRELPEHLKIVDLSADFRLADIDAYAEWYGHEHRAPELQKQAVYGLTEVHREEIRSARLVANPGCYTTAAQLPLVPLLEAGVIATEDIIIDAKSGVSGAGRALKQDMLFAEVGEGIHAYAVGKHRHMPEIEQELSLAAGAPIRIAFTPHLVPMNRGMLATIYVKLASGASIGDVWAILDKRYDDEPFVRLLPDGAMPATRHVRGSNHCLMGLCADRLPGRVILVAAIDNLVKGASGQALQNMNLMTGLSETSGLDQAPLFP